MIDIIFIVLILIAIIYHDSARLNEGKDFWDKESGINLYKYLTESLDVSHDKAKLLAEAVANKDYNAFGSDEKNHGVKK